MKLSRGAVVIPAFGKPEMTAQVVADCLRESELVRVLVVDNRGDYEPVDGDVQVIRPGQNLGWLRGTNLGIEQARRDGAPWVVALNNDTRLSAGFFAGLHDAVTAHPGDLVAPCYDDHIATQNNYYRGPLEGFSPQPVDVPVPLIDGTCYALDGELLDAVGPLDAARFGSRGWGGIEDYILRVRRLGGDALVTRRAYLTHARGSTANSAFTAYERYAAAEMRHGLLRKYGRDWRKHFAPAYPTSLDGPRTILSDTLRLRELRLGLADRRH